MNFKEWFYQNEAGLTGPQTSYQSGEQEVSRQQVDLHTVLNKKFQELAPKQQQKQNPQEALQDMVDLSGTALEADTRVDAIKRTLDRYFPQQAKSPHWENFVTQFKTWNNNLQTFSQKISRQQPTEGYNPEFFVQGLKNFVAFLNQYARAAA